MTRRQSQLQNTKHKYVLDRLSSYMDGHLSVDEHARVEAHLRTCDSCRDDLKTLRWTHDLLQEVVPVPVPRSFVIREADVARPRRSWLGGRPLATLQWATALVAVLLVLVVTGDVWIGARLVPGGEESAVSIMRMQPATDKVAITREKEVVVTSPVQSESPAEPAQAPATPPEAAMLAEGAPADKAIVDTTRPVLKDVGETEWQSQLPPQPGEESPPFPTSVPKPGEQPAHAVPAATQPADGPEHLATRFPWLQAGWRVAEIGLGALLVGLLIVIVWVRLHKTT
jgi:hypothetical protein